MQSEIPRMPDGVSALVASLRRFARVSLDTSGSVPNIRVSPAKALPPELKAQLIARKPEVVAYLQRAQADVRQKLADDMAQMLLRVNARLTRPWAMGTFSQLRSTAPHLARRLRLVEERGSEASRAVETTPDSEAAWSDWRAVLVEWEQVLSDVAHEVGRSP